MGWGWGIVGGGWIDQHIPYGKMCSDLVVKCLVPHQKRKEKDSSGYYATVLAL